MKSVISITNWMFPIAILLFTIHPSYSEYNFKCSEKKGRAAPVLPKAYSTNIRINFLYQQYTMEVKYATIGKSDKELIEIKTKDKHAKYITRGDQKSALYIQYKEDEHPTCQVTESTSLMDLLKDDFAGEKNIFSKAAEVMMYPNMFDLYSVDNSADTGVFSIVYEGCLSEPNINVSLTIAAKDWVHPGVTSLLTNVNYPVIAIAEIGNVHMTAVYSNFDPSTPDDAVFQPPEDVYCAGFRADKKPPKMPDYFTYNSQIIVYESAVGLAPIVSHREVYYDYPAGISRMDFYDPLAEDSDLFSPIRAQRKSIIHDYNAGAQYIFNTFTGQCTLDTFQVTFNAISFEETKDNKMLKGDEYFWLDDAKTSYNGQFLINGLMADVYTAMRVDPKTKKNLVISWAFSTEETRVVESENVDKNVLLRMYVRPETDMGYENVVQINFDNFEKEEPNVFTYDLTSCFNDSSSKTLVLTYPASDLLTGSGKVIGRLTHLAVKDVTGMRKQRIYIKEVIFSEKYIYVEFTLMEDSTVKVKVSDKQISLDDALKKLKKAVSIGNFTINVPTSDSKIVKLHAEYDGLNIFSGDRNRKPSVVGYQEGSVISLTIGMLFLGFLLGGVTLNLVMSKKFGVSLFQKSGSKNAEFNNPLNESSM